MTVSRGSRAFEDYFDRAQEYSTTPGQNGWTIADTSAAGQPTYANITADGGAAKLTLESTNEAQIVTFYHKDILAFDMRQIKLVEFVAMVAGIDSVTTLVFGLGSARNDTADSVATNAWFRIQGSVSTSAVVVESDDATIDNDDIATGASLAAMYKKCSISFENGLSDVRFFVDGERVAAGTTFNMSALAAGLNVQPMIMIQKASGTGVPSVTIASVNIEYKYAYGA